MATPTLKVEMAFGYGPLDAAPVFVDLTALGHVLTDPPLTCDTGRSTEQEEFSPGRASFSLDNRTALFDPRNTGGTYYGDLVPGVPVRITGTWSAVSYPMFYGFVESWPITYRADAPTATVQVEALDALSLLAGMVQPDEMSDYVSALGNCALWLRTCDGETWLDWSGNGRHATTSSVSVAPVRNNGHRKPLDVYDVPLIGQTLILGKRRMRPAGQVGQ